jgi:class 3 adenylate cyclase
MEQEGYLLDPESELFFEDPRRQRTPSWGRLKDGVEYPITLLRIDIVNNTRIVRVNGAEDVGAAYERMREIFQRIVEKRRGRVWLWEGDGGMAAFQYGHPNMSATLCGMEFMNEMLLYNLYANPLDKPIQLRAAAHAGFMCFNQDTAELLREELVKETVEIESRYTAPNSFSISASIAPHVDGIIKDCFASPMEYCPREILSYSIHPRQPKAQGYTKRLAKERS